MKLRVGEIYWTKPIVVRGTRAAPKAKRIRGIEVRMPVPASSIFVSPLFRIKVKNADHITRCPNISKDEIASKAFQ